jgi:predicted nucleotidyltransferase component of viral defense system
MFILTAISVQSSACALSVDRKSAVVVQQAARPFAVDSRWVQDNVSVINFSLEELLVSKLRALYQRKKGRVLFDPITHLPKCP